MKISKSKRNNIIFLILLVLMIIPHTRLPIQVMLHKGLALIAPSQVEKEDQIQLDTYNWRLENQEGEIFNFEANKGKVVFINFWATWCPPCIAEMPSIHKLYNDYDDKVEFIFVSNESNTIVKSFLNKNNYSFEFFNSISKTPNNISTSSIPRTFLIDKEGNIVIDKTGASNWNSDSVRNTIDNLLK